MQVEPGEEVLLLLLIVELAAGAGEVAGAGGRLCVVHRGDVHGERAGARESAAALVTLEPLVDGAGLMHRALAIRLGDQRELLHREVHEVEVLEADLRFRLLHGGHGRFVAVRRVAVQIQLALRVKRQQTLVAALGARGRRRGGGRRRRAAVAALGRTHAAHVAVRTPEITRGERSDTSLIEGRQHDFHACATDCILAS